MKRNSISLLVGVCSLNSFLLIHPMTGLIKVHALPQFVRSYEGYKLVKREESLGVYKGVGKEMELSDILQKMRDPSQGFVQAAADGIDAINPTTFSKILDYDPSVVSVFTRAAANKIDKVDEKVLQILIERDPEAKNILERSAIAVAAEDINRLSHWNVHALFKLQPIVFLPRYIPVEKITGNVEAYYDLSRGEPLKSVLPKLTRPNPVEAALCYGGLTLGLTYEGRSKTSKEKFETCAVITTAAVLFAAVFAAAIQF